MRKRWNCASPRGFLLQLNIDTAETLTSLGLWFWFISSCFPIVSSWWLPQYTVIRLWVQNSGSLDIVRPVLYISSYSMMMFTEASVSMEVTVQHRCFTAAHFWFIVFCCCCFLKYCRKDLRTFSFYQNYLTQRTKTEGKKYAEKQFGPLISPVNQN